MSTQYTTATNASISTAALPPHPFPCFFCSATGGLAFALTGAGFGGAGGAGGGGLCFLTSLLPGPPPFAAPAPSSGGAQKNGKLPERAGTPPGRGGLPP